MICSINSGQDCEGKELISKLQDSEKKFRTIFENHPHALILANATTGLICDINKNALDLIGLPAEKIIGMHQTSLHPHDEMEKAIETFSYRPTELVPITIPDGFHILNSKGEKIPVKITGILINIDKEEFVLGIFEDTRKEEQLKRREEIVVNYKKHIFEAANDPQIIVDLNDIVLDVNRAFELRFDYMKEELVGKIFPKSPENMKDFQNWVDICRESNGVSGLESIRYTKSGEPIHVSISISPIRDTSGELKALSFHYRDITSWKKYEEAILNSLNELKKISDTKDRIYDTITKDLAAQVSNIKSLTSKISSERLDLSFKELKELIHNLDNNAHNLNTQLRALGKWTKLTKS